MTPLGWIIIGVWAGIIGTTLALLVVLRAMVAGIEMGQGDEEDPDRQD